MHNLASTKSTYPGGSEPSEDSTGETYCNPSIPQPPCFMSSLSTPVRGGRMNGKTA